MPSWMRRPSTLIRSLPTYRGHGSMVCTALLWATALPTPGVMLSLRAKYSSSDADAPPAPASSSNANAILVMTGRLFVVVIVTSSLQELSLQPTDLAPRGYDRTVPDRARVGRALLFPSGRNRHRCPAPSARAVSQASRPAPRASPDGE